MSGDVVIGDPAPEFELPSSRGGTVKLSDFKGKSSVLLAFYPGDFTMICTTQLCSYSKAYEEFQRRGFEILGIGVDPIETHRAFVEEKKITFPLLTDKDGHVCRRYGVAGKFIARPKRSLFVIDKEGIVRFQHIEMLPIFHQKVDAVLELLEKSAKKKN